MRRVEKCSIIGSSFVTQNISVVGRSLQQMSLDDWQMDISVVGRSLQQMSLDDWQMALEAALKAPPPSNSFGNKMCLKIGAKMSPMGSLFVWFDLKRQKRIAHGLSLVVTRYYPGEVATPTAEMLVAKLLFNSVVSTKDAQFMTMEISNFYLMTPLTRPEYIRFSIMTYLRKLLWSTISRTRPLPKELYTSSPIVACMGYHKAGFLQMSHSKSNLTSVATFKASWFQDFGNTLGDQYSSHWLLTTLVSSMWAKNMLYI